MKKISTLLFLFPFLLVAGLLKAQEVETSGQPKFEPLDVFQLEYVSDPQISPDGQRIIYIRNSNDIMSDGSNANLWSIDFDGSENRPLTTGNHKNYSPRWSADGKRLLYLSTKEGSSQLYLRWLDTGAEAKLTNLQGSPSNISWSPDEKWIAFTMLVPENPHFLAHMPKKPKGAKWAKPPKYIDRMNYRADGAGYLKEGFRQIFVLSVEGGTPRQVTFGPFHHNSRPAWSKDSKALIFSANRHEDWEFDPRNSEIYELELASGTITALTHRQGPDNNPVVSPDGKQIAYLGFDDRLQGYQLTRIHVMNRDGTNSKVLLDGFDRNPGSLRWSGDGKGLFFQYDNFGNTKIAFVSLNGEVADLAENVGGLSIGRPYSGGVFSVAANGNFAFTHSQPDHPADLAVGSKGRSEVHRLTRLNDDLFGYKPLGQVEEIWFNSTDGLKIQGWICKPPDFDPAKKYPLLLEIHGGPFANYGDRFSAEIQLYAAAGYVVLYANPRGSTSYGEEFGNKIHHDYPNKDYDDLMAGVDVLIAKSYMDENQLYVTGGSGGGVLTAWIVGKTARFRAAVVAKPVINWYSFVLYSDGPGFFYKYWFPGLPWDNLEQYMKRSPISYAGNVKTPTMLLTGEEDYRTPIAESEQFYAALKLNKVETAMVRIPESGHHITSHPSYLIAKVLNILAWFDKHK